LLTFLGGLAGYCLLGASEADRPELRWWLGFVAAAVAMLYTHYFGLFLLLAYMIYFLIVWLPLLRGATRSDAPGSRRPALPRGSRYPCRQR